MQQGPEEYLKVIALDSSKFVVWEEVLRLDLVLKNMITSLNTARVRRICFPISLFRTCLQVLHILR